jgi:two-component system nitrate/nitrite response regulator NarL
VSPIRVLVADDHGPTRADVRASIERDPELAVCAEVADAPAAIESALRERPDVCLLDVRMPGGGIAAAWEIAARCPQTRIVMLTVSSDDAHLFGALRAGADGYLLKDIEPTGIGSAIHDAAAGKAAMSPWLMTCVIQEFRDNAPRWRTVGGPGSSNRLTSREWEVVALLRRGQSTHRIAHRLRLSPATVRSHIASAAHKLGAPDRDAMLRLLDGDLTPAGGQALILGEVESLPVGRTASGR